MDRRWMSSAKCAGMGVTLFFTKNKGRVPKEIKELCSSCSVNVDCLLYAMETESSGIWAGTSAKGRAKINIEDIRLKHRTSSDKTVDVPTSFDDEENGMLPS